MSEQSPSPRELGVIQRWLQSVITHPDGVLGGVSSQAAHGEIDVSAEEIETVILRSQALTSVERLHVYANAYYARLLECLREEFPALSHALGEETFDAFAFGYLQSYPSRSYTLADLAASFPQYLRETRPADDGDDPNADSWPDFLIDLAVLERAYSDVFDGPGVEGRELLTPERLAEITPESWPLARLRPAPCLRLLRLRFPVHEYVTAVRRGEAPGFPQPGVPQPEDTWLVITRREFVVRRCAVSRAEFALLQMLVEGHAVAEAIERSADEIEAGADDFAALLQEWFRHWAAAGYFESIEAPAPARPTSE